MEMDWNNVILVSRFCAHDNWKEIASLKSVFSKNCQVNYFLVAKTLHRFKHERLLNPNWLNGKWLDRWTSRELEKWNIEEHGRNEVSVCFGGWVKIYDLSLNFWNMQCFQAIGTHLNGLPKVASKALNMLDCSAAFIQGENKVCGFIPTYMITMKSRVFVVQLVAKEA